MEQHGDANVEVLSFRVERYDGKGNRLTPVPVQISGKRFVGALQEGDQVRVKGDRNRNGILVVKQLENLTTRSTFQAKGGSSTGWIANLIWIAIVLAIVVTCLSQME